jgi:hypothetical protein
MPAPLRFRLLDRFLVVAMLAVCACSRGNAARQLLDASPDASPDPLPSWNEGRTKSASVDFVARVTTPGGRDFSPVERRIATFDNDGTLWPEVPIVQVAFVQGKLKAAVAKDPTLAQRQPFKAALAGDLGYLVEAGEPALVELLGVTSANMTDEQFGREARNFFAEARHPKFGVPYTDLAYRPMVELLEYLRAHGFETFISSGGGMDFMRLVSKLMYGIPPENVIGSRLKKEFRVDGERPVLWRTPDIAAINDKETKPVNIDAHIGKRPLMAAGNVRSGGDIAMLEYSQPPGRTSLQLLVNHDDAEREFAYGEKNQASLTAAREHGWHVVSIKRDWRTVFALPKR